MHELLTGSAVYMRVTGLDGDARSKLSAFGPIDDEGERITFTRLGEDRIPELVALVVALGGRVFEVVPRHQTLEDRFLQLLHEDEH
jgi:hypothetical protein